MARADGVGGLLGGVRRRAPDLPRELLGAMQNQMAQMQRVVDRERLQGSELAARILAPIDAVLGLLEEGGATLRREAEALETAGRALQETAGLMKRQAELFEQTIGAMREPAELAKAAAGLDRRSRKARSGTAETRGGANERSSNAAKPRRSAPKQASGGANRRAAPPNGKASHTQPSSATAKRREATKR